MSRTNKWKQSDRKQQQMKPDQIGNINKIEANHSFQVITLRLGLGKIETDYVRKRQKSDQRKKSMDLDPRP
jgi:hypothetical protein